MYILLYFTFQVLEIEFQFWIKNRSVTFQKDGKTYIMARYYAPSRGPRPESYRYILFFILNSYSLPLWHYSTICISFYIGIPFKIIIFISYIVIIINYPFILIVIIVKLSIPLTSWRLGSYISWSLMTDWCPLRERS